MNELLRHRVTHPGEHMTIVECATEATDGPYSLTVEWSDEDDAWLARAKGHSGIDESIGDGVSREAALQSLVFSLMSLVDAVNPDCK